MSSTETPIAEERPRTCRLTGLHRQALWGGRGSCGCNLSAVGAEERPPIAEERPPIAEERPPITEEQPPIAGEQPPIAEERPQAKQRRRRGA